MSKDDPKNTPAAPVAELTAEQQAAVDKQFADIAASVEAAEKEAAEKIAAINASVAAAEKEAAKKAGKGAVRVGSTIVVGCRLPNGIILEHPLDPNIKVEIAGLNKSRIIGAPYAVTTVSREFWELWSSVHKDFGPMKVGSIFAASNADIELVAEEVAKEKTGFEGMAQDAMGVKKVEADK